MNDAKHDTKHTETCDSSKTCLYHVDIAVDIREIITRQDYLIEKLSDFKLEVSRGITDLTAVITSHDHRITTLENEVTFWRKSSERRFAILIIVMPFIAGIIAIIHELLQKLH